LVFDVMGVKSRALSDVGSLGGALVSIAEPPPIQPDDGRPFLRRSSPIVGKLA